MRFFFPDIANDATLASKHKEHAVANAGVAQTLKLPAKPKAPPLTKDDLVHITDETIRSRNLTIDPELQKFIGAMAVRYKLYYGSIAVMDAYSGEVLALYGATRDGEDCTLSLDPELAASIFKLVTATAAVERGYSCQSMFSYSGNAHTLYKNQLTNRRDRWTMDISLEDAFARSNNIVFGKLGTIYLGQAPIFLTAKKLGFYKSPLKEISTAPSTSFFPKDDYNLAELSCGFNKLTRISPLHAAQMVTAVLNRGYMVTPRLVNRPGIEKTPVMREQSAQNLSTMMERTVKKGTVSKTFRSVSSDKVLKSLSIGGKSGSIDGKDPVGRRNWFVGFAKDPVSGKAITIGCLLILDNHFWIEADMLSRLIMKNYFSRVDEMTAQRGFETSRAGI